MNKVWSLTKVSLGVVLDFGFVSKKKSRTKKSIGATLITLCLVLIFTGVSFIYNYSIGMVLNMMGLIDLLPQLIMTFTSLLILISNISKVKGILFGFKDYDLIMSLPVKTSSIVISRLLLLYIYNMIFVFIIMVPSFIVYGLLTEISFMFYISGLVLLLFVPLIPMVIATLIGLVIALISARFKKSSFISIILYLLVVFGIMIGTSSINSDEEIAMIGTKLAGIFDKTYPMSTLFKNALCDGNLIGFISFIGISTIIFLIYSWLVGLKFKFINSYISSKVVSSKYKFRELKIGSPFKALYKKELKRYFSSSLYFLNTAIGLIMITIAAISTLFVPQETLMQVLEIQTSLGNLIYLAPIGLVLAISTVYITACSISLEGNNLWILKSSPISIQTIFNSKIMVNLTVTIPAIVFNSIVIGIGLKATILEYLPLIIMPVIYSIFFSIYGLILNMTFPNFTWTSEVLVIKQSASSMITMFSSIIIVFIPFILFVVLGIELIVINWLLTIFTAILACILYKYLIKYGNKKFCKF